MVFTTLPGGAVAGSVFGVQPVIRTQDTFNNNSTVGLGANRTVTLTLTSGTGTLQGTVTLDLGTAAGRHRFVQRSPHRRRRDQGDRRSPPAPRRPWRPSTPATSWSVAVARPSSSSRRARRPSRRRPRPGPSRSSGATSSAIRRRRADHHGQPVERVVDGCVRNTADGAAITTIDIAAGELGELLVSRRHHRDADHYGRVRRPDVRDADHVRRPRPGAPTPALLTPVNNAGKCTRPDLHLVAGGRRRRRRGDLRDPGRQQQRLFEPRRPQPDRDGPRDGDVHPDHDPDGRNHLLLARPLLDGIGSSAYSTSRTLFIVAPGNWQLFPLTTTVRQSQAFTWQVTATNTTSRAGPLYCIRIAIPSANFTGISAVINSASGHTGWVTAPRPRGHDHAADQHADEWPEPGPEREPGLHRLGDVDGSDRCDRMAAQGLSPTACGSLFSANPTQTVTVVANTAPTVPALTAPADSAQLTTGTPVFTWAPWSDANGGAVSYRSRSTTTTTSARPRSANPA